MVNLDLSNIETITPQHLRVLQAIEQGMRNHEYVPMKLIIQISRMSSTEIYLNDLLRLKLVSRYNKTNYGLTYLGYDYLALTVLKKRNLFSIIGTRIGVGKEADVYIALQSDDQIGNDKNGQLKEYAIKFHKLGLSSFKTAKYKRQYLNGRSNVSWMYLGRLSALREFGFMVSLYKQGFPCPEPISLNRHCVVMSFEAGIKMAMLKNLTPGQAALLGWEVWKIHVDLLKFGIVHGDLNEYNLIIRIKDEFLGQNMYDSEKIAQPQEEQERANEDINENTANAPLDEWIDISKLKCNTPENQFFSKIIVIDFPQMISITDKEAEQQFDRDIKSYENFLNRRFKADLSLPRFSQIIGLVKNEIGEQAQQNEENQAIEQLIDKKNLEQDQDSVITMSSQKPSKNMSPYLIQASETFVRNQIKIFNEAQYDQQKDEQDSTSETNENVNDVQHELAKLYSKKKGRDVKERVRVEGNRQMQRCNRTDLKGTGRNKVDLTKKEY